MGCPKLPQRSAEVWCRIFTMMTFFHVGAGLAVGFTVALSMSDVYDDEPGTITGKKENHPGLVAAAVLGYIAAIICIAVSFFMHCGDDIMNMSLQGAFLCYLPYSIPVSIGLCACVVLIYIVLTPVWLVQKGAQWCAERPARLQKAHVEKEAATHRRELAAAMKREAAAVTQQLADRTQRQLQGRLLELIAIAAAADERMVRLQRSQAEARERAAAKNMATDQAPDIETPAAAPCVSPGVGSAPVMNPPTDLEAPPPPYGAPPAYQP